MKKEHELFVPLAHQLELGMMFGASRFAGDVPATVVTLFVVLASTTTAGMSGAVRQAAQISLCETF